MTSEWDDACARREGVTHFELLQVKKAGMLRAALKSGMSASALERLPKPIVPKVEKLPPVVLATRAHATNFNRQDGSRRSAQARVAGKDFKSRPWVSVEHLREVIDAAARRFKMPGRRVSTLSRDREVIAARHVCVTVALEVTGATQSNLAAAMGLSLDVVKNSRAYGQSVIKNYAGYAEKYGAAKADILARWPEYRSAA